MGRNAHPDASRHLRLSRPAAFLVLAAYFLRAFVPDGWMPAGSEPGGGFLVICTAAGLKTIAIDDGGTPAEDSPLGPQHDGQICPFGGAPFAALPAAAVVLTAPEFVRLPQPRLPSGPNGDKTAYPPYASRAPPLST